MSDTLKRIEHNPHQTHSLVLFDLHLICVRSKADTTISHQRKWHRLAPCWLWSGLQLLEHQIKAQGVSKVCLRWSDWDYLWNLHISVAPLCKLLFAISVMSINLLTSSLYGCTVAVISAAQLWFLFLFFIILWQTVRWIIKMLLSMLHLSTGGMAEWLHFNTSGLPVETIPVFTIRMRKQTLF